MNIACMCELHSFCICWNAFQTDFSRKVKFKSNVRELEDFHKNALISKTAKHSVDFGRTLPVSKVSHLGHSESVWIAFKRVLNLG